MEKKRNGGSVEGLGFLGFITEAGITFNGIAIDEVRDGTNGRKKSESDGVGLGGGRN